MATVTSGSFPALFAGNGTTLYVHVSSFHHTAGTVPFAVHAIHPDGSKTVLRRGQLVVPPFEVAFTALTDVDDRVVEVVLQIPHEALKPTVSLIGTFLADGAQTTLLWIPPDGFSPLPGSTPVLPAPRRRRFRRR